MSLSVVCDAWYYSKSSTFLIVYNLKYPSMISNYFFKCKIIKHSRCHNILSSEVLAVCGADSNEFKDDTSNCVETLQDIAMAANQGIRNC